MHEPCARVADDRWIAIVPARNEGAAHGTDARASQRGVQAHTRIPEAQQGANLAGWGEEGEQETKRQRQLASARPARNEVPHPFSPWQVPYPSAFLPGVSRFEHGNPVGGERGVGGHHRHAFGHRLGDEHAVEGVVVVAG